MDSDPIVGNGTHYNVEAVDFFFVVTVAVGHNEICPFLGVTVEDFNIHLSEDNELVISMEKKNETKEENNNNRKYLRREFSYSKFEQALVLPDDVEKDKISANVTDGVLTVDLPKRTPEEKAKINRVIEIH